MRGGKVGTGVQCVTIIKTGSKNGGEASGLPD